MEVLKVIGIAVIAVIMVALLALGIGTWKYGTAEFFGKVDEQVQLESSENRIVQYERFFSLCSSVQNQKASLAAQKDRLESAYFRSTP